MKTAFDLACAAYQLRKEAENRARLRALQHDLAGGAVGLLLRPRPVATPPGRGRA